MTWRVWCAVVVLMACAGAATEGCTGDGDCSLNGVCTGGVCVCDAAWTGPNCSSLNFLPANKSQGFNHVGSSWSSWGGSAVQDPKTGRWYLGVDEMSEHCGLGTWHTNSHCIIASSTTDSPGGPYVREMVVVDPWCHGSSLAVEPLSGRWIFGHMGSGATTTCSQCSAGVTPEGAHQGPCPHNTTASSMPSALIASSPLGPWTPAPNLINGANCEPFFLPNGTLFYACPWGGKTDAPNCNGQSAFLTLSRAESLDDALKGVWTYKDVPPTLQLAGGSPDQPICVNWEDQNIWVDGRGNFHTLFHAWRGQPCDYPLPGCHGAHGGESCTSLGGHGFSRDGRHWYISPDAPYNNTILYDDGTSVAFRARERPHLAMSSNGAPLFLINGLGDPPAGGSGDGNTGKPGADHTFTGMVPLHTD
eukprot:m.73039 g.73039  ORF g.73039 m.73039 type:complete len:418 (+) comp10188_c0_seq1:1-1254(+)